MDPTTVQAIRLAALRLQDRGRDEDSEIAELVSLVATLCGALVEDAAEETIAWGKLAVVLERSARLHMRTNELLARVDQKLDRLEVLLPEA